MFTHSSGRYFSDHYRILIGFARGTQRAPIFGAEGTSSSNPEHYAWRKPCQRVIRDTDADGSGGSSEPSFAWSSYFPRW